MGRWDGNSQSPIADMPKPDALADDVEPLAAKAPELTQAGINLIKEFEGLRLAVYLDPVGIPTVGYGQVVRHMKVGERITLADAERLLRDDLASRVAAVRDMVKVPVSDAAFSALVSFAYNCGVGALAKSTLLRKLNSGDKLGAANEFLKWNRAGGQVLRGLTRRREAERKMFLSA